MQEARARERQLLSEAGAVLASSLDPEEAVRDLVRVLVPRIVDWCSVRIVDEEGALQPVALAHEDPAVLARGHELERQHAPSARERTVVEEVLRTGRSILLSTVTDEMLVGSARSSDYLEHTRSLGICSAMFVALCARGRTFGVMVLATDGASGRALDEGDLALIEEIAARAALAIDNARLFAEVERGALALEHAVERLRILAEASSVLATALDDVKALELLAEIATRSLADWALTYAYCEEARIIRQVGLAHRDPERRAMLEALASAMTPSPSDEVGVGAVIREGHSSFVPDVSSARWARTSAHARLLEELEAGSVILVPLVARGRTIGAWMLAASVGSGRHYTREDRMLVEKLARDAALLVDNARLLRLAQEAARARDELVAAVSHDLRNPLQVLRNAVTLLESNRGSSESRAASVRAIAQCTHEMERFVLRTLDVARLEERAYPLVPTRVDARTILAEAMRALAPLAEQKALELTMAAPDEPALVEADPDAIQRALANVLGNAVKFVPIRGRVRAEVARDGEHVRFRVEDSGPGIAESELPRLFDRFFRAQRARASGTGLGLAIAKGLVDAHGGQIHVTSCLGRGSTFEIVLPAADRR